MASPADTYVDVSSDLCRLARFGANIADAHSCFIFMPRSIFLIQDEDAAGGTGQDASQLVMTGGHSLSSNVISDASLSTDSGLIGWVAKHKRSIHVSPFEHDSRTLGVYSSNQFLKSFIGIPVAIEATGHSELCGVIACDSKKSYAFSKLQGKLLEDLSLEVSRTLALHMQSGGNASISNDWNSFLAAGAKLVATTGRSSIEALRMALFDFSDLEAAIGTEAAVSGYEQLFRLITQILPPTIPLLQLPDGSLVLILDSMLAGFYENRIRAMVEHAFKMGNAPSTAEADTLKPNIEFFRASFRDRRFKNASLEDLIRATTERFAKATSSEGIVDYGYRRA